MEKESLARMDGLVRECRVCHGVEEAQRGPILDGMEYGYLYDQLQKFRSGIRGQNPDNRSEHLMGIGIKKVKNDLESAYLADWFARQEPKPAVRTVVGDLDRGKLFYDRSLCIMPWRTGGRKPFACRTRSQPFGRLVLSRTDAQVPFRRPGVPPVG